MTVKSMMYVAADTSTTATTATTTKSTTAAIISAGAAAATIGFPGQFRNYVDQIHFMSIQFRRFGSCTTDLSFDFIFPAFAFCIDATQI